MKLEKLETMKTKNYKLIEIIENPLKKEYSYFFESIYNIMNSEKMDTYLRALGLYKKYKEQGGLHFLTKFKMLIHDDDNFKEQNKQGENSENKKTFNSENLSEFIANVFLTLEKIPNFETGSFEFLQMLKIYKKIINAQKKVI